MAIKTNQAKENGTSKYVEKTPEQSFRIALHSLFDKIPEYDWSVLQSEVEMIYNKTENDKAYKGGYLHQNGVYQNLMNFLLSHSPSMGASVFPRLAVLQDVDNIAHDVYNNGWYNQRGFYYTSQLKDEPKAITKIRRLIKNHVQRYYDPIEIPFKNLDLEYALNASVRFCIQGEELNDAAMYPNLIVPDDEINE